MSTPESNREASPHRAASAHDPAAATDQSPPGTGGRVTAALLSAIIACAVVGYFVGIHDGVPHEDHLPPIAWLAPAAASNPSADPLGLDDPVPAVRYAEMRRRETGPTSRWNPTLDQIPQPSYDLFAEITPSEQDKQQSTQTRAARRAFNGAPPIIPHAVENTSDAACYACHGKGLRVGDRVANQMSHVFLANCTQCHAPPPPKPFAGLDAAVANTFVGLPAPLRGERAFPGGPPTIPHSTWMRETCLACHGHEAGWAGLESTHPWRVNCQQCHAPSAMLEQAIVPEEVGFLAAPRVEQP